jgi:outer membrane protein assembly factor BamB
MKSTTSAWFAGTSCILAVMAASPVLLADWPEWRGPTRDGVSTERSLPVSWSPTGDNLAWRAPYGSRSGPVVFGDRLYLQTAVGTGDTAQERVLALDANTGKLLWEHRFSVYLSDVPAHRTGWASPSVDPATGYIYAHGVNGHLSCFTPDGKLRWERSLVEEYGFVTTHGGRTVSPVIEGRLVIVNGLNVGWGELGRGGNRWFAFDAETGQTVWVSSPQKKHYDTNMSPPIVATINGTRLMIVGGSDGAFHALKVNTGEPVWEYELSKRAILTGAVLKGTTAFLTHSEENLDTSEMGMLAAVDASASGTLGRSETKWFTHGFQGGFSSPVLDGNLLYQVDNGAVLGAFDITNGRQLWTKVLGTIQKGSPVLADGKLYVGTENGKFYILQPSAAGVTVLDEDWLGPEPSHEGIVGSPAVSGGRVYVTSLEATYAIGKTGKAAPSKPTKPAPEAPSTAPPAVVQLFPYEMTLAPGETVRFGVRLFDAQGRFIREDTTATWALEQVGGTVDGGGYTAPPQGGEAGYVKATVGGLTGQARVRIIPALPWTYDFDAWTGEAPPRHWLNTTNKLFVRELEGSKVLVRVPDATPQRRTRIFMGPSTWSNLTVEADVRSTERRRTLSDVGLFNQRYGLVLFGNAQKLELQPWQAAAARSVDVPFVWKPDTWYHLKLRVDNKPRGLTLVRGKAWPKGEPEPAEWTVEKSDALGHREGSPGLYADPNSEVYFDNLRVTVNQPEASAP